MQRESATPEKALLDPVPPAGEEGRVNAVFDGIKEHLGFVPDGLRLYGMSPPLLEAFVGNVGYFMGGTKLPPTLTAMIRYLVSDRADCQFCVDMNEGFLTQMGLDLNAVRGARSNADAAPLAENERALLRLALKAVDRSQEVTSHDLEAARVAGWSDRDVFDAVVQAANNRAFNHVLRAFKVERQGVFA
jgi:alkylhydroperoxidase family enzyme